MFHLYVHEEYLTSNVNKDSIKIYIYLEEEGTDVWRPVDARRIGGDIYFIQEDNVVPSDEIWQFKPGTMVHCIRRVLSGEECIVAVEKQ